MEKLIFLTLLSVSAILCEDTTPALSCTDTDVFVKKVVVSTVNGVCTKLPCDFPRGNDVTALITFDADGPIQTITSKCVAIALGITTNFPLPNADKGCDYLQNTFCPIDDGEEVLFKLVMPVLKSYPLVDLDLTFSQLNEKNSTISCFRITAKVVNP